VWGKFIRRVLWKWSLLDCETWACALSGLGGFMLRPAKYAVAAAAFAASVGAGWAADLPVAVKAAPAPAYLAGPWLNLFGGVTASPDSIYGEAGAVFAFNRNLDVPGWLFRVKGGGGD